MRPRVLALLWLCLASACSAPEPTRPPPVVLIGLDGADWEPVRALRARGRLPHLGSLVEGGASGVLHSVEPMLSPMLWTTIATGRTPPDHGILDFFATDAGGRRIPVPSQRRRVRALWNIAGDYGCPVAFIGWQVTHPAERVEGVLVSDRVLGLAEPAAAGRSRGIAHPADLEPALAARVVTPEAIPEALLARFLPADVAGSDPLRRDLRLVLAHTETLEAIALELMTAPVGLLGIYFPGIDEVSHLFGRYAPPRLPGVSPAELRRYGGVVEEFYVYQDEVLGEILARVDPDATIFVVSDHGFRLGRARPQLEPSSKGTPYAPLWHRDNGLIVAKGPGIRPGLRLRGASILDVAPTILAQLEIPSGQDMDGRVLDEIWAAPPRPVARVPTHERPGWRPESSAPVPEAAGEVRAAEALAGRLRALGYLAEETGEPGEARRQAATEYANLAGYHMQQGALEPALAAARRSLREDPGNYTAWRHLASLYRRLGDPASALEAVERAASLREHALEPRLFRVELLRETGAREEARRAAAALAERHPGDVRAHNLLARLALESGAVEQAVGSYRASLALDPDQEAVAVELLWLWLGQGDRGAVEGFVSDAVPGGVDRRLALARAQLRRGELTQALASAELSVAARPAAKQGYLVRGILLGERREYARSLLDFERALALDPEYPEAHFNKGVTHLKTGDLPRAIESLETAAALLPGSEPVLANLDKAYALSRDPERAREALAAGGRGP